MSSKGHAMESKSKRTPIGLNLIAPGKWKQVSEEVWHPGLGSVGSGVMVHYIKYKLFWAKKVLCRPYQLIS